MARIKVRVKTRRAWPNATPSITKDLRSNSDKAAEDVAKFIVQNAKGRVHVITGRLRDSIDYTNTGQGKRRVRVGMHYGIYEEYGTRYRPPHPYFRPAVEDGRRYFARRLKDVIHR